MEINASQVLSVGDRAPATGILVEDGSLHRLVMQAEGQYGEILNAKESPRFLQLFRGSPNRH